MNVVAIDAPTQVSDPGDIIPPNCDPRRIGGGPVKSGGGDGSGQLSWRIATITLTVGLVLGLLLATGGIAFLNSRGTPLTVGQLTEPTSTTNATATATATPVPYAFAIDNALLASKYEEARKKLPPEAQADARLHGVLVECYDPMSNADCTLGYRFYSRTTDSQYDVAYSVFDTKPVEVVPDPADGDHDRTVFVKLPWEQNPAWTKLLADSYSQLPTSFGENGFSVVLMSDAPTLNQGDYDWYATYTDRVTSDSIAFRLRGTRVIKES